MAKYLIEDPDCYDRYIIESENVKDIVIKLLNKYNLYDDIVDHLCNDGWSILYLDDIETL